MVLGSDGAKLSKRHGVVGIDEFRTQGYLPEALVNFLALLGWSYDDKTTIMSRDELVERFTLDRVGASPATFDYQKLDWMNGVYIRALPPDEFADRLAAYVRERGYDWDPELVRRAAPHVQEKIEKLGDFFEFAGFLFRDVSPDGDALDPRVLAEAERTLADVEPFTAAQIEPALRGLAERLELKPRRRSSRSGSRSRARRSRRASSSRSSCSGRTARWSGSAPPELERLRVRERVEGPLELQPGAAAERRRRRRQPPAGARVPERVSTLALPFSRGKTADHRGVRAPAPIESRLHGDGAVSVLVVDDEPSLRLLCRVNLELDGFSVLEAGTVGEARQTLGSRPIEVVILDVHVGTGDGRQLLAELRAQDADTGC